MAGSGFQVFKNNAAGAGQIEQIQSVANTQYHYGDMITVSPASGGQPGQANLVAAADKGTHIVEAMVTPANVSAPANAGNLGLQFLSTSAQEMLLCTPVKGSRVIIKSKLVGDAVPPINGLNCNANTTATNLLVTFGGAAGDFANGTCFVPSLGQQRTITGDAFAGGVHTFTVAPAFSRAPTTGDTVVAVPWAKGAQGVKFNATTPYQCLDTAVANKTGGHNQIEDVFLMGDANGVPYALSSCPDLQ